MLRSIINYATTKSGKKIITCGSSKHTISTPYILLQNMINNFNPSYKIEKTSGTLESIKHVIHDFDNTFNDNQNIQSAIKQQIDLIQDFISVKLIGSYGTIRVHILANNTDSNISLIVKILHAINVFCAMFPSTSYDQLIIYICLDTCQRKLITEVSNDTINTIRQMQIKSMAMCVSGVTKRYDKQIILTRREEIIKLLFHELAHYAKLDSALFQSNYTNKWGLDESFNLSESYAELIGVILTCAYNSIYLAMKYNFNVRHLYKIIIDAEFNYSMALSKKILKFYNVTDVVKFINGEYNLYCPIAIWEYVIGRTIMFYHLDKILDIVGSDLKIKSNNTDEIIKLFDDDIIVAELINNCDCTIPDLDVSYMLIDLIFI